MSTPDRPPLPVELLVPPHQRPIGKDRLEFEAARQASPPADPVDELVAELREADKEGEP